MKEWSLAELEEFTAQHKSGLVYLYTPLCGTCQLAEKMMLVTEKIREDLTIGKININYMPTLAEKWKIESVPCLVFVKNGEIAHKITAFHSVPYLVETIQSVYETPGRF